MEMDDSPPGVARRASMRSRRITTRVEEALLDPNARSQAARARLDALENDNVVLDVVEPDDDEEIFLAEDDTLFSQKKTPKGSKRKTRQSKALERLGNTRKAPRNFLEVLQDANLDALPAHVPTYFRAAVGPPSSKSRRQFCSVCGYISSYTCPRCGARFCSCSCQIIHNDTRCQKFVS